MPLYMHPADAASEEDDGYLSASEIAALKLDAEWLILSACNAASGDAANAEALSGLERLDAKSKKPNKTMGAFCAQLMRNILIFNKKRSPSGSDRPRQPVDLVPLTLPASPGSALIEHAEPRR
jgi:hypothetical protein